MLIIVLGKKTYFWLYFWRNHLNLLKYFAGVSISEKTENFYDFGGFCSPEFDRFLRDLAIFQFNVMEQHSSIQKRQIEIPAKFS